MRFMSDHKQLWENCLREIETSVSRANFSTWFKNTQIVKESEKTIYLGVPNEFVKDWLINKYHKLILKTFRNFQDEIRGIEYVITKYEPKRVEFIEEGGFINKKLPLGDLYINKDDNLNPRYIFDFFFF